MTAKSPVLFYIFVYFFLENLKVCFCPPPCFPAAEGSAHLSLSLLSWGPCCSLLESSQISLNVDPNETLYQKTRWDAWSTTFKVGPLASMYTTTHIPLCKHARSQRPDLDQVGTVASFLCSNTISKFMCFRAVCIWPYLFSSQGDTKEIHNLLQGTPVWGNPCPNEWRHGLS